MMSVGENNASSWKREKSEWTQTSSSLDKNAEGERRIKGEGSPSDLLLKIHMCCSGSHSGHQINTGKRWWSNCIYIYNLLLWHGSWCQIWIHCKHNEHSTDTHYVTGKYCTLIPQKRERHTRAIYKQIWDRSDMTLENLWWPTFFISFSRFSSSWPSESRLRSSAISLSTFSRYWFHWARSCSSRWWNWSS